jgi:hypothetical protein
MANKSNLVAQTISIPQGGGALQGIGETFSPDLHTGTGNFSLPDDPAAIVNPEHRAEVFSWKLSKTADPFGNTIQYEYERDSGDTPGHHWDQLYLKRIQYANYTDLGTNSNPVEKFLVSVTFVNEERPDPLNSPRRLW